MARASKTWYGGRKEGWQSQAVWPLGRDLHCIHARVLTLEAFGWLDRPVGPSRITHCKETASEKISAAWNLSQDLPFVSRIAAKS